MVELRKGDWEEAREQAEHILRQTEISRIVNENLFKIADEKIKEFPEERTDNNSSTINN